ncbi:amidohydrolase family protein [Billgrantia saliphila]|uniref:amidohydrolase family protein n=1 Tax=Billgrantia saliphila TaxID=1848458 RepID=UPI000CE3B52F|nr:amidohydrolase family protein [Halomonas saliphila]
MRIDAHQHFWRYAAAEYPWIDESMTALRQDYLPEQLARERTACGIQASIAVQARPSEAETRWLLELSDRTSSIVGVVGWVDLTAADLEERLAQWSHPRLCGFRHLIQDEEKPAAYMADPAVRQGIRTLQRHALSYDVLVTTADLGSAYELCTACGGHVLVLDHLGKPNIRDSDFENWRRDFRRFGELEHVACKLSGLITEADWQRWQPKQIWPYLDTALDVFGEQRLMFGSDWPVCLVAGSYTAVYCLIDDWATRRGLDKTALFGGNAQRLYRIGQYPADEVNHGS